MNFTHFVKVFHEDAWDLEVSVEAFDKRQQAGKKVMRQRRYVLKRIQSMRALLEVLEEALREEK